MFKMMFKPSLVFATTLGILLVNHKAHKVMEIGITTYINTHFKKHIAHYFSFFQVTKLYNNLTY
jgi:hypothetical protein